VDIKNRVFVPAEIRRAIDPEAHGKGLVLLLGRNKRLWLYPEKYYQSLLSAMPPEVTPDDDMLNFQHLKFSLATRLEWDEQGRLVLPDKFLTRASLQKELSLVGAWDHLELWNRADWERRSQELVDKSYEIEFKGKLAMNAAKKPVAVT
jgi:MraZ protein